MFFDLCVYRNRPMAYTSMNLGRNGRHVSPDWSMISSRGVEGVSSRCLPWEGRRSCFSFWVRMLGCFLLCQCLNGRWATDLWNACCSMNDCRLCSCYFELQSIYYAYALQWLLCCFLLRGFKLVIRIMAICIAPVALLHIKHHVKAILLMQIIF